MFERVTFHQSLQKTDNLTCLYAFGAVSKKKRRTAAQLTLLTLCLQCLLPLRGLFQGADRRVVSDLVWGGLRE